MRMAALKRLISSFLYVFLLISLVPETLANTDCSEQAVASRLSECVQFSLTSMSTFGQIAETLCESVDCSIKCYSDAVSQCLSQGVYQTVDLEVVKVVRRFACENPTGLVDAWTNCGASFMATTCFTNLLSGMTNALALTKATPPDYVSYKTDHCSAVSTYKTCSTSTPFTAQGSCTANQATMITNLYDIGLSVDACSMTKTNAKFNTLNGAIDCKTGGAGNVSPILSLLIAGWLLIVRIVI